MLLFFHKVGGDLRFVGSRKASNGITRDVLDEIRILNPRNGLLKFELFKKNVGGH